eukprot:GHRR01005615.1.p1 GENE.GHRR01005615.1~~GHRR01005615.1.p1  ORF type:complete len:196 (+),score=69.96 GHRR01005615.1:221-808(+)
MTADTAASVASLAAAGDDLEALAEAIIKASFLDKVPGEDRQKLRAARTKLRKLLAAKEAGAGAGNGAANGRGAGLAERSPHAKSSYDVSEFDALIGQYESLKWRMISKPGGAVVKPDDFYRLYALHMQATQGDNTSERPMWAEKGGLDFEGRARWDAWSAVKGLEADKAKLRFVRTYYEFPPGALYADTRGGVTA